MTTATHTCNTDLCMDDNLTDTADRVLIPVIINIFKLVILLFVFQEY